MKHMHSPFLAQFAEAAPPAPGLPPLQVAATTGLLQAESSTVAYIEEALDYRGLPARGRSSADLVTTLTEARIDQVDPDRIRVRQARYHAGMVSVITKTVGEGDPDRARPRLTSAAALVMATFYTRDGLDTPDRDRIRARNVRFDEPKSDRPSQSRN